MPEDLRKFAKRVASVSKGGADEEQEKLIRQYQEEYDKQFAEEEKRSREDEAMRESGLDPAEQRRLEAAWAKQRADDEARSAAKEARVGAVRKTLGARDDRTREQLAEASPPVAWLAEKMIGKRTSPETDAEAESRYAELSKNEAMAGEVGKASSKANALAGEKLNKLAELSPGNPVSRAIAFLLKKRRDPKDFKRDYEF